MNSVGGNTLPVELILRYTEDTAIWDKVFKNGSSGMLTPTISLQII